MAIIALTSAAGSPGVTTTALGMALSSTERTLLIEADPAGSAILPGYYRGTLGEGRSLLGVAMRFGTAPTTQLLIGEAIDLDQDHGAAADSDDDSLRSTTDANRNYESSRDQHELEVPHAWQSIPEANPAANDLPAHDAQAYDGAPDLDAEALRTESDGGESVPTVKPRLLVPGVANPGQAAAMEEVWPDLAEALLKVSAAGYTVICDLGRITQAGYPLPMLRVADLVMVLCRNPLASVMRSRSGVQALAEQMGRAGRSDALAIGVLSESDQLGYSAASIGEAYGAMAWSIAWEPSAAAVLSDGVPEPRRRWGRTQRLYGSYRNVLSDALRRIERRNQRLEGNR